MKRMKLNRKEVSSSRVSHPEKVWCKCGKCEPMLTEKECRCSASNYLNGNIRGRSRTLLNLNWNIYNK